jgi:hypothetical protein
MTALHLEFLPLGVCPASNRSLLYHPPTRINVWGLASFLFLAEFLALLDFFAYRFFLLFLRHDPPSLDLPDPGPRVFYRTRFYRIARKVTVLLGFFFDASFLLFFDPLAADLVFVPAIPVSPWLRLPPRAISFAAASRLPLFSRRAEAFNCFVSLLLKRRTGKTEMDQTPSLDHFFIFVEFLNQAKRSTRSSLTDGVRANGAD